MATTSCAIRIASRNGTLFIGTGEVKVTGISAILVVVWGVIVAIKTGGEGGGDGLIASSGDGGFLVVLAHCVHVHLCAILTRDEMTFSFIISVYNLILTDTSNTQHIEASIHTIDAPITAPDNVAMSVNAALLSQLLQPAYTHYILPW